MLQADGVGWEPISIEYHLPIVAKLLLIYLLVVVLWTLAKMIRVFRQSSQAPNQRILDLCTAELRSVRRWIVLTVMVTLAACADMAAGVSRQASYEKWTNTGVMVVTFAEVFTTFSLAMCTSAVLYALAMLCEMRVRPGEAGASPARPRRP